MQKGNDTLQIRIMNFKTTSVLVHLLNLNCTDNEKFFHYGTKNFLLFMLMSIALLSMPKAFAWDVSVKPISDKLVLKTNDTRWIRLGAGYRGTGLWTENLNGNLSSGHYSNDNEMVKSISISSLKSIPSVSSVTIPLLAKIPECLITFWMR